MVDAGQKPEVAIVVQARMTSGRLPRKIALPVKKTTLLGFLLSRLRAELAYPVWVATSEDPEDDATEAMAVSCGVGVVRGSLADVFSRFQKTAQMTRARHLVRLTADNPLVDVSLLQTCVRVHLEKEPDLTSTREIAADRSVTRYAPKGTSVDVLKSETLLAIPSSSLDAFQKEHVIPVYFEKRESFRVEIVKGVPTRGPVFSVDTREDYEKLLEVL